MIFTLDELIEFITLCARQAKDAEHESYPAFVAVREALYALRAIDHVEAKEEASGRVRDLSGVRADEGYRDPDRENPEWENRDDAARERLSDLSGNGETG